MSDAETIVQDGVSWARFPNGAILRWDADTQEWLQWDLAQGGAQPPKKWLKDLGKADQARSKEAQARFMAEQKAAEQFRQSPQGQARAAREAGAKFFQVVLPVSVTTKAASGEQVMFGAPTSTRTTRETHAGPLELIEAEGWHLEHVGYVFQPKGSQSRDRFLASGQIETVVGDIVGIYTFRAAD